jgi:radical S-adenosyl methionine domain-containing protein 2
MDIVFNWHITEACNYSCDYCFAKWGRPKEVWKNKSKVEILLSEISAAHECKSLRDFAASQVRLNLAGGEPTLLGNRLVEIAGLSKRSGIQNSLITNGSLLRQNWELLPNLSMIGISIDSLVKKTNSKIGRTEKNGSHISYDELKVLVAKIRALNPDVMLKFNVVVSKHNYDEIIVPELMGLNPGKIKIFRELSSGGNVSDTTNAMFQKFLKLNQCQSYGCWVEDNELMTQSYLMIDPLGRLFQDGNSSGYVYSEPVYNVGLENALEQIEFDKDKYLKRYKEVAYG